MAPVTVRVSAPAKINLYLAVGGVRPDGYHSVTTVLQALEFADELRVTPADELSLVCDRDLGIPAQENLAYRAALAMTEEFGREAAVHIELTKRVPDGAGLGGGSSDAAAVVTALAYLWELPADDSRLTRLASGLGADVPFFLTGGAAVFAGKGDRLQRTLPAMRVPVALVRVPDPVPTAAAYRAFDEGERPAAPGPRHVTDAMCFRDPAALGAALYNNMTDAAIGLVPEIAHALALCEGAQGVHGAALCGSGSAVFALCHDDAAAEAIVRQARERGWWGEATHTGSEGVALHGVEEDL